MENEIEAIRERHEAEIREPNKWTFNRAETAHADRATLLRALDAIAEENAMLKAMICTMIENEPDDAVSDGDHTVLDLWRHDARAALKEPEA